MDPPLCCTTSKGSAVSMPWMQALPADELLHLVRCGDCAGVRSLLTAIDAQLRQAAPHTADPSGGEAAARAVTLATWESWTDRRRERCGPMGPAGTNRVLADELAGADALWLACHVLPSDVAAVATQPLNAPGEDMVRLMLDEFPALFPLERAAGVQGTTALLECLLRGALRVSCLLLSRGADPTARRAWDQVPALLAACSVNAAAGAACESSSSERAGHLRVSGEPLPTRRIGVASVVREMLRLRADAGAQDCQGRSALLACVLCDEEEASKAILHEAASAEAAAELLQLRARTPGCALTPLAAAVVHGSPGVLSLVLEAAAACGLAELATQERLAAEASDMMDAICDRVEAAALAGEGDHERACAAATLELLAINTDEDNPLLLAVTELLRRAPLVCRKAWSHASDVAPLDLEVLRSLRGRAADGRPLLLRLGEPYLARAAGKASWHVAPECHRFNQLCLRPLQRMFGNAIPTVQAISAIAVLGMPIVELGCGTGYWAKILRSRGVDVAAYDICPPPAYAGADSARHGSASGAAGHTATHHEEDDSESIFDRALVGDIHIGGPEVLAGHSQRALLLAWPYEGTKDRGWDVECLEHYGGWCTSAIGAGGQGPHTSGASRRPPRSSAASPPASCACGARPSASGLWSRTSCPSGGGSPRPGAR